MPIYWDDVHLLRALHQMEVEGRAYQMSGDLLLPAVANGRPCSEEDQRSLVRLLLLLRSREYVLFEQMHYARVRDPGPEDQNFLHSLWHFQLTERGRDRAQARVLQARLPELGEDDGRPISSLILRRFADGIARNYNEEQVQLFMRDCRLPPPKLETQLLLVSGAKAQYIADSLELLEAGDIEMRRHLRRFLASYLNGDLDAAPDSDERNSLVAALARAGWHLKGENLIAGERIRAPIPTDLASPPVGDIPIIDASGPIFLVHGHDEARLQTVARFIERISSTQVVILHEQPNQGRTLIEKFEHNAAKAAHAVVLLTADDLARPITADSCEELPRGRQNVVLELGFFIGKLGRQRVTVLRDPKVEEPSDISGLVYIPLDPAGKWMLDLAQDLRADGIDIDVNRLA